MRHHWLYLALLAAALLASPARADDYTLTLKDHQFSPKVLTVPAHQKIRLVVRNLDEGTAEFESSDLNREKLVGAHSEITVFVGPLEAGKYGFFDDFHKGTTGTLIAQ